MPLISFRIYFYFKLPTSNTPGTWAKFSSVLWYAGQQTGFCTNPASFCIAYTYTWYRMVVMVVNKVFQSCEISDCVMVWNGMPYRYFLVVSKSYRHFFSKKYHIGIPRVFVEFRCVVIISLSLKNSTITLSQSAWFSTQNEPEIVCRLRSARKRWESSQRARETGKWQEERGKRQKQGRKRDKIPHRYFSPLPALALMSARWYATRGMWNAM